ncbi:response regulator [Niabella insulamsoli]|uniref:response regulator n=1 Tax=Niabella insulamsoli TaxID=3144874 RepID=UPI0031FE0695
MGEENNYKNILYVDDEVHNLNSFRAVFRRSYNIFTALSAEEGRKILAENTIHLIITDQRMPGTTGIEFLESIIKDHPSVPRILLTGYTDINAVIDAINKGSVYKYVQKPWSEEELRSTIENALKLYTTTKSQEELTDKLLTTNEQLEFLLRQNLLS